MTIPTLLDGFRYNPNVGLCYVDMGAEANFFLVSLHSIIALVLSLYLGPPVIKKLRDKTNHRWLSRTRVLIISDEVSRQGTLGLVMFATSIVFTYVGIVRLLIKKWDGAVKDSFLTTLAYSSCGAAHILTGGIGFVISLTLVCRREYFHYIASRFHKKERTEENREEIENVEQNNSAYSRLEEEITSEQRQIYWRYVWGYASKQAVLDGIQLNDEELMNMVSYLTEETMEFVPSLATTSSDYLKTELNSAKQKYYHHLSSR